MVFFSIFRALEALKPLITTILIRIPWWLLWMLPLYSQKIVNKLQRFWKWQLSDLHTVFRLKKKWVQDSLPWQGTYIIIIIIFFLHSFFCCKKLSVLYTTLLFLLVGVWSDLKVLHKCFWYINLKCFHSFENKVANFSFFHCVTKIHLF